LDRCTSLFTPPRRVERTQAAQLFAIASGADDFPFPSSIFFSVKTVTNLLNADINIPINIKTAIKR
jgi:hypothetical protein